MAEVRLSMEEYEALLRGATTTHIQMAKKGTRAAPKRKGKSDPKMARALKKANAMGRKKSGGFKKGWTQGKIMIKAHKLRRKM